MESRMLAIALAIAIVPAGGAIAQQALVVGGNTGPMLRIGTEVIVKTRGELTTKHKALKVGQRFEVETSEPVSLNGQVVIPVGTPGIGEVTTVRNKGMWGKSGHFDVRLIYLRVNDRQIRLSGIADNKGTAGGIGAAAVSAVVFLPAGFFMTGTSASLPPGTIIKGSLDEDVPVAFASVPASPTPIVPLAIPAVLPPQSSGTAATAVSTPIKPQ